MVTWSQLITVHVVGEISIEDLFEHFKSIVEANLPIGEENALTFPEEEGAFITLDLNFIFEEFETNTAGYANF